MLERPAHRRRRLPATWVALVIFTAACSPAAEDGTSHIEVGDLSGTPLESRFAGEPKPLTGRIAARADGCVTVVIDGVERLPLWPAGTAVKQRGDDEDGYVVTLAGGVTPTAPPATASRRPGSSPPPRPARPAVRNRPARRNPSWASARSRRRRWPSPTPPPSAPGPKPRPW